MSRKIPKTMSRIALGLVALASLLGTGGCASLIGKATSGLSADLSAGILDSDDPTTVSQALPAYLVLLDGLIAGHPDDGNLPLAGAKLYSAYAGSFVADPDRRRKLAGRAEAYARKAVCASEKKLCAALDRPYEEFAAAVDAVGVKSVPLLHVYGGAVAGVLQADTGNWQRIADLPKIEHLFERVRTLDPAYDHASSFMYLGVLNCLRPESFGGKPEAGKKFFDEAVSRSGSRNLMAKSLEAEFCARLTFDQELHDRLLDEVLKADAREPGLTLSNTLAQERARALLASGKDYF